MITEYFSSCMNMEQLEKEHRRLVLQMHPDRNPDNPNATAEFQEMQAQYEERKAELNGDYTASARGRARREQAEREREERERKERERNRLAEVIAEARKNKEVNFKDYKVGDHVYAKKVNFTRSMFEWDYLSADELLRVAIKNGTADETVVMIEHIFTVSDKDICMAAMSNNLECAFAYDGSIFGGWETIQKADPSNGVYNEHRVAKVVMWRSEHFCVFGNPKGDKVITDYYLPFNYNDIFADRIMMQLQDIQREEMEEKRKKAERRARLLNEQQDLLDEWQDKLVSICSALNVDEQKEVAYVNLKTMLKGKFPGVKFKFEKVLDSYVVHYMDGPTSEKVSKVLNLFDTSRLANKDTPWQEKYGGVDIIGAERTMSTITKAKILSDLTNVDNEFRLKGIEDEITMSPYTYNLLHLLVGIDTTNTKETLCHCRTNKDGGIVVRVDDAIQYVFYHTSYVKPKATKKRKAKSVA